MHQTKAVLVVEDDQSIAELIEFMLQREGFQVTLAQDGRVAETLITALQQAPAVILLDIMLPFVNGFELLQTIRNKPGWQHTPILMLSARSQENDIVRALELGATDYIIKPFQPAELIARINRVMKKADADG